jgi:Flp pilus assembly protein TadD
MGRLKQALRDFNRVLRLAPGDPDALEKRGCIYHRLGRRAEAARDFTRMLKAERPARPNWRFEVRSV